ncbi:MAG: hypothetical protein IJN49_01740, partial [Clostridia bacterium]|nr:hypothetical protein [Clostridia bacterium]
YTVVYYKIFNITHFISPPLKLKVYNIITTINCHINSLTTIRKSYSYYFTIFFGLQTIFKNSVDKTNKDGISFIFATLQP